MPLPTREEIKLQKQHDALMRIVEAPYIRAIVRAKNKYIKAVAAAFEIDGTLPEMLTYEHAKEMYDVSAKYNTRIIKVFVKDTNSQLKSKIQFLEQKDEAYNKWLTTILQYWLANFTAISAEETASTTRDDIRRAIAISLAANETSAQTAEKILKVQGLSPFRAKAIARTETHNAAMYAGKESAKKLSRDTETDLMKKWIATQDSRTRDAHASMAYHDEVIMEGLFDVGGSKMDRPGDPAGGAKNVINCRCTLSYIVPIE